ncbi:MAG: rod-binding protein [Burkholderiales bacterium]|jgi:flagellar protein FlgJ|nr:rod-binding protein [Burkholderiales bacterium]
MDALKKSAPLVNGLALDAKGLAGLKKASTAEGGSTEQKAAVKESARQVEAMFLDMLMKNMRATRMDGGLFENSGKEMFEGMLDQQRAQALSARGIGLAAVIAQQLQTMSNATAGNVDANRETPKELKWSARSST